MLLVPGLEVVKAMTSLEAGGQEHYAASPARMTVGSRFQQN